MENGTFATLEQMFHFHNILKNLTFERCPKAFVWSKGLRTEKEKCSKFKNIYHMQYRLKKDGFLKRDGKISLFLLKIILCGLWKCLQGALQPIGAITW